MPNKHWDMETDILPETTNTYNLGSSTKKWIVNGFELDEACEKSVDETITQGSTSTNIPTTEAVASYVDGKLVSVSIVGNKLIIE